MTPPLVNKLKYKIMTHCEDQLLLGTYHDQPEVYPHTKKYLKQINTTRKSLLDPSSPITTEEYSSEVCKIIKAKY